ncbi:MAG: GTPase Era, partial [Alphaproteobacteria bacterium]|nr:GTPase Era [Alphaproteobacteria bacterium]
NIMSKTQLNETKAPPTRFGFIAIIGAPNVGKSTLTNALVKQKVAIVTHKVQTTRARLLAIAMHGQSQFVLIDTPGIFNGQKLLDKTMVQEAWAAAAQADAIIVLLDASHTMAASHAMAASHMIDETEFVLEGVKHIKKPLILVLNKIDKVKRTTLLEIAARFNERVAFKETFMISALHGNGVEALADCLAALVPQGVWHYPKDIVADIPSRLLAAEITREKLFLRLHQELPYALTVETENWQKQKDGSVRIEQVIYVRRASQKAIVLGKGGRAIKEIGTQARADMEKLFNHKTHLFLFVKVRDNWIEDRERYRMMGIDFSTHHMGPQTGKQIDKQADNKTGRPIGKQAGTKTSNKTGRQNGLDS